jgi:hypothetical protein
MSIGELTALLGAYVLTVFFFAETETKKFLNDKWSENGDFSNVSLAVFDSQENLLL